VFTSTQQIIPINCSEAVLVTSPKLNFSTYLGGSDGEEIGFSIAVAEDGSFYITGHTYSNDFPIKNAYNDTYSGNRDGFVAKFDANGSLLWGTFFGGNAEEEEGKSIAVTSDGSCYVIGSTESSNFPTKNAYQSTYGGNGCPDAFVAKFALNGSLLWCTYLGGSNWDEGLSLAVTENGNCYVTGITRSNDFPTYNAYDSTYYNNSNNDVFITKFSTNGTLLWSTYLGASGWDDGLGIAVASDESCFVSGGTSSPDFPMRNAFDSDISGFSDAFVAKFTANGSLLWSTYLGGNEYDHAGSISVAFDGDCFIAGSTTSPNFPTKEAFDSDFNGGFDAFVAKFSTTGSLMWSSYIGGENTDFAGEIAATSNGDCYIAGYTTSANFPTKNAYDSTYNGGQEYYNEGDVYVSKFTTSGLLEWSTYLGGSQEDRGHGIAVTANGSCYVTGRTNSNDFPIQDAYDNTLGAVRDVFITKFDEILIPFTPSPPSSTINGFLAFTAVLVVIAIISFRKKIRRY
jgi:Tfp pilus assembly protein PilZ